MYAIRMGSGLLFALIVFPYVARMLGPTNLGKVQFVESIVVYFLLFINLGIPSYGKREIAFVRENNYKRSKLVLELLIIQVITTIVVSIWFFLSINYIPYLKEYKMIFYIFSINIILNFLGVEWFYMGIENQEYITKRKVTFQFLSSIFIFFMIKERNDYLKYTGILVFSLMGSNILNFRKLFEYVSFNRGMFKDIKIRKHINSVMVLFTTALATSIFSNLDSVMVRTFIDEKALGYYSVANKVGRMPLLITTAIFPVIYPRLCNLLNKKEHDKYYRLANQSLDFSLLIAIPSTIGMFVLAPEIVLLLAGNEFSEAITVFRTFAFLITAMAFAVFTGNNLVINLREKVFMKGQGIASVTNVLFNCICIPILGATGAALGTILAEVVAVIYRLNKGKDLFKNFSIIDINKFKILISGMVMGLAVYTLKLTLSFKLYLQLVILIPFGGLIYLINLIVLKERSVYDHIKSRVKKASNINN